MSYCEPDCGYYEPSEFEEECEHLKQLLKESAFKDVQRENASLKAENARMKNIVDNYEAKMQELDVAKRKLEAEKADLARTVRRERLYSLLEPYKNNLWVITTKSIQGPKCDKCDEFRQIHFKSPSGKDCTESCECARLKRHYFVSRSNVVKIYLDSDTKLLSGYYCEEERYASEDYSYSCKRFDEVEQKKYRGQAFSKIKNYYDIYFESKEKAQEYADWLNARVEKEDK